MADEEPKASPTGVTETAGVTDDAPSPSRQDLMDLAIGFIRSTGNELGLGEEGEAKRREFLRGKGLTDPEIEEAHRRAGEGEALTKVEGSEARTGAGNDTLDSPAPPPRNYDTNPQMLQPPPQQLLSPAPNRTIVRFLRTLAFIITVTGGASGVFALFFRRVLHPRVATKTSVLTELTNSTATGYSDFLASLRSYARAAAPFFPRAAVLGSRDPEPPAIPGPTATGAVEKEVQTLASPSTALEAAGKDAPTPPAPVASSASSETAVSEAAAQRDVPAEDLDKEEGEPAAPAAPVVSLAVRDSLGELSASLRRFSHRPSRAAGRGASRARATVEPLDEDEDDDGQTGLIDLSKPHAGPSAAAADDDGPSSHLPEPTAPQSLLVTLESFSNSLHSTLYAHPASKAFVNPYLRNTPGAGAGGASGTGTGGGQDAVGSCKTEIRSLKGMLLNRRNFVGW